LAVQRMIAAVGDVTDLDDVLPMRQLLEFQKSILEKGSTEENYLRPRMEILVDLGLVGRRSSVRTGKAKFPWQVTDTTRRLAEEWKGLAAARPDTAKYLDQRYFAGMAKVFSSVSRYVVSDEERLLWFARGFAKVGREIGFTPASSVATMACLLAYEDGAVLEVADLMASVLALARSPWADFLRFSGGSRFDREFLIKVSPKLQDELELDLGKE